MRYARRYSFVDNFGIGQIMIDDLELMTLRRQDAAELYAEQPGAVAAQEAGEPPDFLLSCLVENVSELSGVCVCVCMFVSV
jgi:hypothetical protein